MLLPNTIIAGAPKCGTTSLFSYLAAHPSVCASVVKETYFLMDPDYPLYRADRNVISQGLEGYGQFFRPCKETVSKVYLEATPDYIYQRTPLEVLPTFRSLPVIVFVLRKPSDRIYSLFRAAQNNLAILDRGTDFGKFLQMVRENDKRLAKRPILKAAIEQSRYVHYLDRWRETMGEQQIHVVIFEDMVRNPNGCLRALCGVLGIDPEYYDSFSFETKNATVAISSTTLQRIKRKYSYLVPEGAPRRTASWLFRLINVSRMSTIGKSVEDKVLLTSLEKEFLPCNAQLAQRYHLDLSCWG